jgi:hypothetical protein
MAAPAGPALTCFVSPSSKFMHNHPYARSQLQPGQRPRNYVTVLLVLPPPRLLLWTATTRLHVVRSAPARLCHRVNRVTD